MRLIRSSALLLAALASAPAIAEPHFDGSETASSIGSVIVASPFILSYLAADGLSAATVGLLGSTRRWHVSAVRPQGAKSAIEMRSDDGKLKLDTTIATKTAQAQGVKAGDELVTDPIGKSGYALKKGAVTIGVLTGPDSGLVHSKARG